MVVIKTFDIPPYVGGRYSVLSAVGLLPAAVAVINGKEVLAGAAAMDQRCSKPDLMSNPAYLNAALHYIADTKKGKTISVMMPYSYSLSGFAQWYCQLWAESLGKRVNTAGKIVNVGQTPIGAIGATDQHSQVQLYIEGPNNKIITFIGVKKFRTECKVPRVFPQVETLNHLADGDLANLLNNELLATEFALEKNSRPSVKFTLAELTPENIGALLYLYEVQTAFAGRLYGINAFDQPGVEEGKQTTHALMGRKTKQDKEKIKEFKAYQKERKKYKCP